MIKKLRESWRIFKNAKDKFNRDKSYASELVEKVHHLKSITKEAYVKNKEFVDFINTNLEKYPIDIHEHLKGLVSLFKSYGDNQEDYLYVLFNVYFTCNDYYRLMKCKLEVNDFGCVKEYYDELINALKRFEEQYKICIYEKGRF